MVKGDRKIEKYRGSSGHTNWDAIDRQDSKQWYDIVIAGGASYIDSLDDYNLENLYIATAKIERNGDTDWNRIVQIIGKQKAEEVVQRVSEHREKATEEHKRHSEQYGEARRAELEAETTEYRSQSALVSGMLHSDFSEAYRMKEVYGSPSGDWLEDPVGAYLTGGMGFAEEIREKCGIKLQITLSLDMSNSMWGNGIATDAVRSFIVMGTALDGLAAEWVGSLYTASFLFAMHEDGKAARYLESDGRNNVSEESWKLGEFEQIRELVKYEPYYAGQDTWISPLFEQIEKWENAHSDPGCVKLDVIISDGVLEHAKDVREADVIQDRRDGALQSVILNFIDDSEWKNVRLPRRCIQYHADKENLGGMLRTVIAEFVGVYL